MNKTSTIWLLWAFLALGVVPTLNETMDCPSEEMLDCNLQEEIAQCVPKTSLCNQVPDCQNGWDESVELCGCLPHEFQCNSSHCIDLVRRCDVTLDCHDGSDEQDCETFACPRTHFKCANHKCIPRDKHCDFVNDCGDNSDESDKCERRRCYSTEFQCDNQECIQTSSLCDGVENCKDGSDENETNCDTFFKCPTGHYIKPGHVCDGWNDCHFTHADETNCSEQCPPPNFQCHSGQCLDTAARCDEFCDCPHCDDELNCPLSYCDPSTHWLCRKNLRCIRHEHLCDGIGHCKQSTPDLDEFLCLSPTSSPNSTSCPSEHSPLFCDGRCILEQYRCDYFADCVHGEDEENCPYMKLDCDPGMFRCENHKCIPESQRCDSINDCYDWSDEKLCDSVSCPLDHVRCDSGQCIPGHRWCNHWPNCPDGSDERDCDYRSCEDGEFTCDNGECIPLNWVCYNGLKRRGFGCEDKSHLIDCEQAECREDEFKCHKSMCVDADQICDKVVDCLITISDEKMCEYSCPEKTRTNYTCTCFDTEMNCELRGYPNISLPTRGEPINKLKLSGNFLNNSLTTPSFFTSYGSPMDGLIDLDLSNNSLTQLPDKLFENMWRLQILNLADNLLTTINTDLLSGLTNLIQLHLDGNQIHTVSNGSFLGLPRLTTLDLSHQNLSRLETNTFYGLHSLFYLNLSGNNLENLPDGVFNGLNQLTKLDISHNSIETIGKHVFYGLPKLKNLITDEYRFCCLAPWVETCEPQPDEFSSCEDLMSNGILRIAIWVQGLIALFGNLVVVVWRCRDLQGRKVHSLLITNLAIGDFLMGVYLMIIAITDSHYRGVYMLHEEVWRASYLCHFAGFVSTFSSELSVLTLTIITLDRLICIIFPLRFARLSVRNAVRVIFAVWLLVFLISIVPLSGMDYFQNFYGRSGVCLALHVTPAQPAGWEYSVSVFLVLNFLSFLVIASSYIWMFLVAKKTRSAARAPESKTEAAMARRMTFIVVTDFACWVPIILLGFASLGGVRTSNQIYAWVAVVFLPVNSAINPVLYTLSTAPFMLNFQKRVRGFRKSFMTSQNETKQSYMDHRTAMSETDRRQPLVSDSPIKMKKLRITIRGQTSDTGSSV